MVSKHFEAGYPNTTGFRKVVKATIMVKKKDGMSDEDFIEVTRSKLLAQTNKRINNSPQYYNNQHARRAVPILQRHGIISYSLVTPPCSSPACH